MMDAKISLLRDEMMMQIESIPRGRQRYGSKSKGQASGLGLSSANLSGPQSLDDKPNSDEKTELDEELEKIGAENEQIQMLIEKFDLLQDKIVPEKLAKFKESLEENHKIFEAKIKKGINKKIEDNAKGVASNEKKMEKNAKSIATIQATIQKINQ